MRCSRATSRESTRAPHFASLARLPQIRELIDQGLYFVLHAPRQVGETTSLLHLGHELTAEGGYVAILVSMEVGAAFPHDPGAAELAILDAWRRRAEAHLPPELWPPPWPAAAPGVRIAAALAAWARAASRPLVVFLDEIDALRDESLVTVLRQIRDGYTDRPRSWRVVDRGSNATSCENISVAPNIVARSANAESSPWEPAAEGLAPVNLIVGANNAGKTVLAGRRIRDSRFALLGITRSRRAPQA